MDSVLLQKLLAAVEEDRLTILCGAGLSMASPSSVPSAASMLAAAADKYKSITGGEPPRDKLENLLEYLISNNQFLLFINRLVDWAPFRSQPNEGHFAVADFLSCNALDFAATTNVDELIEIASKELGESDFLSTLDQQDLTVARPHRPLVKLHGCVARERLNTVWCISQTSGGSTFTVIKSRINFFTNWLRTALQGRHLILVGFWSDWAYLNGVLEEAIIAMQPPLVVVVDPDDDDNLKNKAPKLWAWAHKSGVDFYRVAASGKDFLDELRTAFSRRFLENLLAQSATDFTAATGKTTIPSTAFPNSLSADELYELRRDATGLPPGNIVRAKRPSADMYAVGVAHLILRESAATPDGSRYQSSRLGTVRIVKGSGRPVSAVKQEFAKAATNSADEVVICAGAYGDGGVLADIVGDREPTVVRVQAPGEWLTLEQAHQRLSEPEGNP